MKIILTQADFRIAISDFLAKQGMNPDSPVFDSMEIDIDDIEVDLNPSAFSKEQKDKPVQQRKRRTRAEIEADEAKAKMNPVYETTDPVPTQALGAAIEPVVQVQETVKPTPESLFEPDLEEDTAEESLGSIVDDLEVAVAKTKAKEPESIFG